jgi:hypothetical protein
MADASATFTELLDLQAYFNDATAQLREGKIVRLDGIDSRIAAACLAVQQADSATQQQCMPQLTTLIDMLRVYEADLRQLQGLIQAEMKALPDGDDAAR